MSRGEEEEFDEIKRLIKSEVHPEERNRLVAALGCSRDPNALRRHRFKISAFLNLRFRLLLNILNPTTSIVKKQDIHFLLASMNSNPVGREITTNFLIDNWGKVVER